MAKANTSAQADLKTPPKNKTVRDTTAKTKAVSKSAKPAVAKKSIAPTVDDMSTRFYDALISFPDPRQETESERRSALSQIRHIADRFQQLAAAAAANHGMHVTDHYVLLILSLSEPDCIAQVADLQRMLGFTSGGVTRCLDRMVAEGLVERVSCPKDRRAWQVQLTRKGKTVASKIRSATSGGSRIREMHAELSRAEWETLDTLLKRISDKMAEIF